MYVGTPSEIYEVTPDGIIGGTSDEILMRLLMEPLIESLEELHMIFLNEILMEFLKETHDIISRGTADRIS